MLSLIGDNNETPPFRMEGAEVRFYSRMEIPTVTYTPEEGLAIESETEFVDSKTPSQRYWTVPFIGNGTYKP